MSDDQLPLSRHLAWSYRRTSTARQAREDRSGMERQEQALAQWLADHPEFELQEQLVDPGVSASTGANRKRGALSRFIAAAQAGQVPKGSVLVVESLTRFSREEELDVVETLMSEFWSRGLGLAVCAHNCNYSRALLRAEPHRMHMLWGSLSQARAEADERSRRSKGGARRRERLQEEGEKVAAATPWWIQRDTETRRLKRDSQGNLLLDPVALTTINRAVELAIGGLGTTLIARQLDNEKRPLPPTARRRNQYRDAALEQWGHGRVSYMLRHPALIGDLVRRDGRTIAGFYPPVLSPGRWAELRASMGTRDKLRGTLRGGGQKTHNLFTGLTRCGMCGGPFSFHASSERSRIGHPGYMACRAANRRDSPTCSNSGYLNYLHVEDHLLTSLTASLWHQLLGDPHKGEEMQRLQQRFDGLGHQRRSLEVQLSHAEERMQELWLGEASDLKQEMAEAAVAQLRGRLSAVTVDHQRHSAELALAKARPTGEQAAAELKEKVMALWQQLDEGSLLPEGRRAFNRWIRTRRPSIEFRICPPAGDGGQHHIELVLDGQFACLQPLAPGARRLALHHGIINPVSAWDEPGVGSGVVEADGTITFKRGTSEAPAGADADARGYQQGLEDARRLRERGKALE